MDQEKRFPRINANNKGITAFHNGEPLTANPYSSGSSERLQWICAWFRAKEASEN